MPPRCPSGVLLRRPRARHLPQRDCPGSISPDGSRLAVDALLGIAIVDLWSDGIEREIVYHPGPINAVAWGLDGELFALIGSANPARSLPIGSAVTPGARPRKLAPRGDSALCAGAGSAGDPLKPIDLFRGAVPRCCASPLEPSAFARP